MTDLDLDKLEKHCRSIGAVGNLLIDPAHALALIERVRKAEAERDELRARLDAQTPDEDARESLDRAISAVVSDAQNHPVPSAVLGRDVSRLRERTTDAVRAWLHDNGWTKPDEDDWEYGVQGDTFLPNETREARSSNDAYRQAFELSRSWLHKKHFWPVRRRKAGEWEPVEPR